MHRRSLPSELWLAIFSFLSFSDVCSCSSVCSEWYQIVCDDKVLWKDLYLSIWEEKEQRKLGMGNQDGAPAKKIKHDFKELFKSRHKSKINWLKGKFSQRELHLPGSVTQDVALNEDILLLFQESCILRCLPNSLKERNQYNLEGIFRCFKLKGNQLVVGMCRPSSFLFLPDVNADIISGIETTEELNEFADINCLDFDCKNLVAGVGSTVHIFEPFASSSTATICLQRLKGHGEDIRCIQLDEKMIVTAGDDCSVRMWSRNSPSKSIGALKNAHKDRIYHLQFDDHKLVTSSADSHIKIWDLRTRKALQDLHWHTSNVYTFQFDRWKLVSGSHDQTVRIFDMSNGQYQQSCTIDECDPIEGLQFCGNTLITSSAWTDYVTLRDFSA